MERGLLGNGRGGEVVWIISDEVAEVWLVTKKGCG